MFIVVIDKPVVFLVPCLPSQATHSIHTGTYYKIFKQERKRFSLYNWWSLRFSLRLNEVDEQGNYCQEWVSLISVQWIWVFDSDVFWAAVSEGNPQSGVLLLWREKRFRYREHYSDFKHCYIFSRLSFVVVEVLDKAGSEFRAMIILLWTCKDCRSDCLMKLCGTFDVSIGNFSVSGASSSGLFWAFSRE